MHRPLGGIRVYWLEEPGTLFHTQIKQVWKPTNLLSSTAEFNALILLCLTCNEGQCVTCFIQKISG